MAALTVLHIVFVFALGACVGSFLNVVVWRLPRGESLVTPPSRCPKCGHKLAWYDNVPIFGWLWLRGKCRYCANPISPRYPTVEFMTAALFAATYLLMFVFGVGPDAARERFQQLPNGAQVLNPFDPNTDWPILAIYLFTISCLLAASLIDLELFIIPMSIPYVLAAGALAMHAIFDRPTLPGALNASPAVAMLSAGGTIGLLISVGLWYIGVIPGSFPLGEPLLDVDDREAIQKEIDAARANGETVPDLPPNYTRSQVRYEIAKEMVFLTPPMLLGALALVLQRSTPFGADLGNALAQYDWVSGLLGSLFGAMVGAGLVWVTRVLGTFGFGRVAMGLGDVHLMFGIGAAIGGGRSSLAFFLAPFMGLLFAIWSFISKNRRELPYGPYLSVAAIVTMFLYCPILRWLGFPC